ncbi:unnamed protein product [Danaus chrysippus]|uniref:(African queen) hypothetical protein n=1 Tax=Danaus chrysippus TaxID=151541 RepID=A0A8J2QS81_9NEOP|nr:unnamed protein product [Danaus chrysippus]
MEDFNDDEEVENMTGDIDFNQIFNAIDRSNQVQTLQDLKSIDRMIVGDGVLVKKSLATEIRPSTSKMNKRKRKHRYQLSRVILPRVSKSKAIHRIATISKGVVVSRSQPQIRKSIRSFKRKLLRSGGIKSNIVLSKAF